MPPKRNFSEISSNLPSNETTAQAAVLLPIVAAMLDNPKYSDFKITCHNRTFNCHRFVICTQSIPLAAVIDAGLKEIDTRTVDLPNDDATSVESLLAFLYTGGYQHNNTTEVKTGNNVSLLAHTKVYLIAKKYDIERLKVLAALKFKDRLELEWNNGSHELITSLVLIYGETLESDRLMKEIAVDFINKKRDRIAEFPGFETLCKMHSEFGYGLFKASVARIPPKQAVGVKKEPAKEPARKRAVSVPPKRKASTPAPKSAATPRKRAAPGPPKAVQKPCQKPIAESPKPVLP